MYTQKDFSGLYLSRMGLSELYVFIMYSLFCLGTKIHVDCCHHFYFPKSAGKEGIMTFRQAASFIGPCSSVYLSEYSQNSLIHPSFSQAIPLRLHLGNKQKVTSEEAAIWSTQTCSLTPSHFGWMISQNTLEHPLPAMDQEAGWHPALSSLLEILHLGLQLLWLKDPQRTGMIQVIIF